MQGMAPQQVVAPAGTEPGHPAIGGGAGVGGVVGGGDGVGGVVGGGAGVGGADVGGGDGEGGVEVGGGDGAAEASAFGADASTVGDGEAGGALASLETDVPPSGRRGGVEPVEPSDPRAPVAPPSSSESKATSGTPMHADSPLRNTETARARATCISSPFRSPGHGGRGEPWKRGCAEHSRCSKRGTAPSRPARSGRSSCARSAAAKRRPPERCDRRSG